MVCLFWLVSDDVFLPAKWRCCGTHKHKHTGGLARALQGVKTVIALGRLGALLPAAERAGVERVVLLSTAGKGGGVQRGCVYGSLLEVTGLLQLWNISAASVSQPLLRTQPTPLPVSVALCLSL